ncbi:Holliday junction DNA helicase RuvA [Xanthobacter versatilis]|uniref:Holliday junction branch migration complex subunit RuvA n=1 Tax=Xanthobacter autotrophicus (strain ATCC BAA-1158 / Py2) TaxID=78245 RepID=RUVA_XANP2|nr:RecName: Full=Holliday junction branch migration complex subunit RuvA [Xanthobacter autotrophicus Py2]ABS68297.1 Holliday junction DNA helicase RuvA [Xanthobacter autotrophicus Py2]
MIGKLKGVVDTLEEDHVILDVHGVGYLVHCSGRTLSALPRAGEAAALFIETHVREDQIRLFGFSSAAERDWFRLLQGIQGIGTKTALAVLSTLSASELTQAIALGDKTTVARAPGVGPRVATRIITELKDKMPGFSASEPLAAQLGGGGVASAQGGAAADAVSALVNLGYGVPQANAAIAAALRGAGEGAKTEVLIRLGLKELAK